MGVKGEGGGWEVGEESLDVHPLVVGLRSVDHVDADRLDGEGKDLEVELSWFGDAAYYCL